MKLVDQYIYAIHKKLPYDSRNEIAKELKSNLLDDIESKYGNTPSESEIKDVLLNYGSPSKVANQYNPHRFVIGSGFTDLYFFIAKMILLGLSIAFLTVYIVSLFTNSFQTTAITKGFVEMFYNIVSAMLPAFAILTIIFIILTRLYKEEIIDLEESWTPNDLKDIKIEPQINSLFESIFTIVFTSFGLILLNFVPTLLTIGEKSFEVSGIKLGHYIDVDRFKYYLIFISVIWIGQIIYHIALIFQGNKTKSLGVFEVILEALNILLLLSIVLDNNMYAQYENIFGFRAIFVLVLIISIIELFFNSIKYLRIFIFKKA